MNHKRFRRGIAWSMVIAGGIVITLYDFGFVLVIALIALLVWMVLLILSSELGWF